MHSADEAGVAGVEVAVGTSASHGEDALAQLLRRHYGYTGELRAVGDVMIDTIHYQARVGFDSFLVKPGHDPVKALEALKTNE